MGSTLTVFSTDIYYLHVFRADGTLFPGWGTQAQSISNNEDKATIINTLEPVIGDIDGDGYLEVVALGSQVVKIWKYSGTPLLTIDVPGLLPGNSTPVLADVDNNHSDAEIVFGCRENIIYAYKHSGEPAVGFPVYINQGHGLINNICIDDVDNNDKNDLVVSSRDSIYVWETNGSPSRIEWGSARHNPQNTGEYHKICPPVVVRSNTVWSSNMEVCGNVIVESGTLTINSGCAVTMKGSAMFIVKAGAGLHVNGGSVLNANIKALPQSSVNLTNNGQIKLRSGGELNIHEGALLDYQYGEIK